MNKTLQPNAFWWTQYTTEGHCKIITVAVKQNTEGLVRKVVACQSFNTGKVLFEAREVSRIELTLCKNSVCRAENNAKQNSFYAKASSFFIANE